MTARACVDASVVVKTILEESDSTLSERLIADLLDRGGSLIAPLHLPGEVLSAVYKRVRDGELSIESARTALRAFESTPIRLAHPHGSSDRALEIAVRYHWKFPYDALYLALGELLDCDVWTADRALYAAAHASFPRLRLLSDYVAAPS